jgi:uncharacterized membrane protein YgcG
MNVILISWIFSIVTLASSCTLWGIVQWGFIVVFLFPMCGFIPYMLALCLFTMLVLVINCIQMVVSFLGCGVIGVLFTVISALFNLAVLYCASKVDPTVTEQLEKLKFWKSHGTGATQGGGGGGGGSGGANVTTV